MESEIVWDKFRSPGILEPYIVHFPNYTKGEWTDALSKLSRFYWQVSFFEYAQ